ncbi:MAG TPA: HEAT repeat domain-containing protein, partial [Anaerolineales bacterium]|nr:HEAT repeat domain-containing protein [Anaerolineales bacterium]
SRLQNLLDDLMSGDEDRAEGAVSGLVELGEEAISSLLDLTRSQDVDSRWWALRTLAQSPLCRTEWLIPFLTDDPAPEIRQCAALGLSQKPDESATQPLVQALNDEDGMVSSLAANALVKIGSAAVPSLIGVVTNGVPSARISALRALAEIKDHRAIPIMMKVMQEDSALLQHWAKEGLDRLGLDMVYIKSV